MNRANAIAHARKFGPTGRRYESKTKLDSLMPGFILGYRTSKDIRYPIIRVTAFNFLPKTFGLQGDIKATVREAIRIWRTRRQQNFTVAFDEVVQRASAHAQTVYRIGEEA